MNLTKVKSLIILGLIALGFLVIFENGTSSTNYNPYNREENLLSLEEMDTHLTLSYDGEYENIILENYETTRIDVIPSESSDIVLHLGVNGIDTLFDGELFDVSSSDNLTIDFELYNELTRDINNDHSNSAAIWDKHLILEIPEGSTLIVNDVSQNTSYVSDYLTAFELTNDVIINGNTNYSLSGVTGDITLNDNGHSYDTPSEVYISKHTGNIESNIIDSYITIGRTVGDINIQSSSNNSSVRLNDVTGNINIDAKAVDFTISSSDINLHVDAEYISDISIEDTSGNLVFNTKGYYTHEGIQEVLILNSDANIAFNVDNNTSSTLLRAIRSTGDINFDGNTLKAVVVESDNTNLSALNKTIYDYEGMSLEISDVIYTTDSHDESEGHIIYQGVRFTPEEIHSFTFDASVLYAITNADPDELNNLITTGLSHTGSEPLALDINIPNVYAETVTVTFIVENLN